MSKRIIIAATATAIFTIMMTVAEIQIRSSAKWPPPARHEVGGWEIDDPTLWDLGAAINLPASALNLLAWQTTNGLTYILDDHGLVVYVSWIPMVFLLWYLIATHLERATSRRWHLLLATQVFITLEMLVLGRAYHNAAALPVGVNVCFWAWTAAILVGWGNLVSMAKRLTKDPHQA